MLQEEKSSLGGHGALLRLLPVVFVIPSHVWSTCRRRTLGLWLKGGVNCTRICLPPDHHGRCKLHNIRPSCDYICGQRAVGDSAIPGSALAEHNSSKHVNGNMLLILPISRVRGSGQGAILKPRNQYVFSFANLWTETDSFAGVAKQYAICYHVGGLDSFY